MTEDGLEEQGLPPYTVGVFRMVFEDGELSILDPPEYEIGFRASYSIFRDQIEAQGDADTVTATVVVRRSEAQVLRRRLLRGIVLHAGRGRTAVHRGLGVEPLGAGGGAEPR